MTTYYDKLNTAKKRAQSREALTLAWSLARNMAHQQGGKPREYLSETMTIAWAEVLWQPEPEQVFNDSDAAVAWAASEEGKTQLARDMLIALCGLILGLIVGVLGFEVESSATFMVAVVLVVLSVCSGIGAYLSLRDGQAASRGE